MSLLKIIGTPCVANMHSSFDIVPLAAVKWTMSIAILQLEKIDVNCLVAMETFAMDLVGFLDHLLERINSF